MEWAEAYTAVLRHTGAGHRGECNDHNYGAFIMSAAARAAARASLRADGVDRRDRGDSVINGRILHLDLTYRLPPACGGEAQMRRLAHEDLPMMDTDELRREAGRVQMALLFGDLHHTDWAFPWLQERARRCAELIKGR